METGFTIHQKLHDYIHVTISVETGFTIQQILHDYITISVTIYLVISSPEPSGSQGELMGWP